MGTHECGEIRGGLGSLSLVAHVRLAVGKRAGKCRGLAVSSEIFWRQTGSMSERPAGLIIEW